MARDEDIVVWIGEDTVGEALVHENGVVSESREF
jgi:hypothetical protein